MQDAFIIRVATVDDAKGVLDIYKGYVENTAVTFELTVPTLESMQDLITSTLANYPFFVAEADGDIIGFSYAKAYRAREAYAWSVESSIYVLRTARQNGIGRTLYSALENALREMGVLNMYACVAFSDVPDEHITDASIRFHEKMGFAEMGRFPKCGCKFGKWYGITWMGKAIGEHETAPLKPKPFVCR